MMRIQMNIDVQNVLGINDNENTNYCKYLSVGN